MSQPEIKLDVTSLVKAIASLQEALSAAQKEPQNSLFRDACIQRFEYTYELCCKMIKRYLEMSESSAIVVDAMSLPALVRTASEKGILFRDWPAWRTYRDARNNTSHTYNEQKAKEVFAIIPDFFQDAEYLLQQIQQRVVAP